MTSPRTKKHLERIALALRIERSKFSEEMAPCGFCQSRGRRCIVSSSDAKRCSECCRAGRPKCDFKSKLPTLGDWASLDRQRQKLRDEEEEAMAKILRLRKQQRLLDEREKAMIERGLSTLDELDKAEEEEKQKEAAELARQEATAQALNEASDFLSDPGVDPHAFVGLPDSFWAGLGFVDGTPQASQGT